MSRACRYIVIYDITDDQERRRVSKVLEGYGFRVQKSAFECLLSRSGRDRLEKYLEEITLESGFVTIYQLQGNAQPRSVGRVPTDKPDDGHAYIV